MKKNRKDCADALFCVCVGGCALLFTMPPALVGEPHGRAQVSPDVLVRHLVSVCCRATGAHYVRARSEVLSVKSDGLTVLMLPNADEEGKWEDRLTVQVLGRWLRNESQCTAYHNAFEKWVDASYGTASGRPSSGTIADLCAAHWKKEHTDELLLLERLFKYDDPPHVKSGIISALDAMGTQQSLVPLLELMKSDEHRSYSGICAMAAAKISQRVGDTRVVEDIVTLYTKRVPVRGTGLPEEQLRRMPPWPHVEFILALSHLGGTEALKALDELRRAETDPVLVESLDNAKRSVQKRLDEKPKAPAP